MSCSRFVKIYFPKLLIREEGEEQRYWTSVLRHMGTTSQWVLGYFVTWVLRHMCATSQSSMGTTSQCTTSQSSMGTWVLRHMGTLSQSKYMCATSQTSSRNFVSRSVHPPPQLEQHLAMCWRHNQVIKYNGNYVTNEFQEFQVPRILLAEVYPPKQSWTFIFTAITLCITNYTPRAKHRYRLSDICTK